MRNSLFSSNKFSLITWIGCVLVLITGMHCKCGPLESGKGKPPRKKAPRLFHANKYRYHQQGDGGDSKEIHSGAWHGYKGGKYKKTYREPHAENPYKPDAKGRTILHNVLAYSAGENKVAAIKMVLADAPELLLKDHLGRSLIHEAVYGGNKELVQFLLKRLQREHPTELRKLINQPEESLGKTAFMYAIRHRDIELVRLLIQFGARPTDKELADALNFAVRDGHLSLLQYIVEDILQGQALPIIGSENLLHVAAKSDWYDIVEYLTGCQEINLKVLNEEGMSALHYAVLYNNKNTIIALIQKGLDINALNKNQKTPLHLAVERVNRDAVLALLSGGADFRIKDGQGRTVLDLVEEQSKMDFSADLRVIKKKLEASIQASSEKE